MNTLSLESLWSLEEYELQRAQFRAKVMDHKKHRTVNLGEHLRLQFEDALTLRYQIQEMLRIEKIREFKDMQAEWATYRVLLPDADNWQATLMIEYGDPVVRKQRLQSLLAIEVGVYLQVEGGAKITPIANEDMSRTRDDKTSAVHFLRFPVTPENRIRLLAGARLGAGVDHPEYTVAQDWFSETIRQSLLKDGLT